jgi:D-serine deaminase-like pyridoxal phosphate-dependent protein
MIPIIEPTLLLDEAKCRKNIQRAAVKATKHALRFRPHFKTHQSLAIGKWFREVGVRAVTVSSLKMAKYFADGGWDDITIAFPFYAQQVPELNLLASRTHLNLVAVDPESLASLSALDHEAGMYIKIDVGTHRTGLHPTDTAAIDQVVHAIMDRPKLQFKGFMAHAGHTYHVRGSTAINQITADSIQAMQEVKERCVEQFGLQGEQVEISIGDTPGFSVGEGFGGVDEIRPGNLAFYDVMQTQIGSCSWEQIAVAMACPVVAKHADRCEVVIHGGAVHFSKDHITDENGQHSFGAVVQFGEGGWGSPIAGAKVVRLSQEHGIIQTTPEEFDRFQLGGTVGILPIHSCLTADAMKSYTTLDGKVLDHLEGQFGLT